MQNREKTKEENESMEISGEHSMDDGQGNETRARLSGEMHPVIFRAHYPAL